MRPNSDTCDLMAQDCPQGQGCFPSEWGAGCFVAGAVECGEPCQATNDCGAGQICAGDPSRCLAMCERGALCPNGVLCGGLQGRDDVGLCFPAKEARACSVLEQGCPEGKGCYVVDGQQECASPTPDARTRGQSCRFANDCQVGLLCLGASADSLKCLSYCAVDGAVKCGSGVCTPVRGLEPLGVCVDAM